LNDDYARKLGEIEMFMDFSEGVIKAADLENLAYDARASERLDEWERRLSDSLLGVGQEGGAPRTSRLPLSDQHVASFPTPSSDPLDALLDGRVEARAHRLPPAARGR